jgi:hypothetical protein
MAMTARRGGVAWPSQANMRQVKKVENAYKSTRAKFVKEAEKKLRALTEQGGAVDLRELENPDDDPSVQGTRPIWLLGNADVRGLSWPRRSAQGREIHAGAQAD